MIPGVVLRRGRRLNQSEKDSGAVCGAAFRTSLTRVAELQLFRFWESQMAAVRVDTRHFLSVVSAAGPGPAVTPRSEVRQHVCV